MKLEFRKNEQSNDKSYVHVHVFIYVCTNVCCLRCICIGFCLFIDQTAQHTCIREVWVQYDALMNQIGKIPCQQSLRMLLFIVWPPHSIEHSHSINQSIDCLNEFNLIALIRHRTTIYKLEVNKKKTTTDSEIIHRMWF